ncbi:MAG: hypothetical protein WCR52_13780 [Bacteroidota bacterium]
MKVLKIAEEDVADKIDTLYILDLFRHVDRVAITFMCTKDGRTVDDWVDENGHHFVIRLPYLDVKEMTDVKPFMLAKVQERLLSLDL